MYLQNMQLVLMSFFVFAKCANFDDDIFAKLANIDFGRSSIAYAFFFSVILYL